MPLDVLLKNEQKEIQNGANQNLRKEKITNPLHIPNMLMVIDLK